MHLTNLIYFTSIQYLSIKLSCKSDLKDTFTRPEIYSDGINSDREVTENPFEIKNGAKFKISLNESIYSLDFDENFEIWIHKV